MTLDDQDVAGSMEEPWIGRYWRPAIGVMYIVICCFDFIFFPILTAIYQALLKLPPVGWEPLTLKAGGLFHISIGAILTATSFGRSQEKIQAMKTGFAESGTTTTTTSYGQPVQATPPARYPLKRESGG